VFKQKGSFRLEDGVQNSEEWAMDHQGWIHAGQDVLQRFFNTKWAQRAKIKHVQD
jgi:hypothetical protein